MPRKPVHLEMAGGKSPRQRIWEVMRRLKGFTLHELRGELPGGIPLATVRSYVKALHAGGHLLWVGEDAPAGARYELASDKGIEAPRVNKDGKPVTLGLAQEQMWNTLYRLGDMTPRELAHHASTEAVPVNAVAAADYLRNLHRAGYVQETRKGKGTGRGGVQAKYRLVKRTGPRPPMIQRCNAVYDPNLHAVVWPTPDALLGAADG